MGEKRMQKIEMFKEYPPIHRIFELFKDEKNAVYLDSSLRNELGNFSIIGLYPYLELKKNGVFTINGKRSDGSFESYLKEYLNQNMEENNTGLPIVSGAIGYFSFDYGRKHIGRQSKHPDILEVPESIICFYDVFIIEDHKKEELYIIANGHGAESQIRIDDLKAGIFSLAVDYKELKSGSAADIKVKADFQQAEYLEAIKKMIHHIIEGDIYIVNMTQQLRIESSKKPYDFFEKLRVINPSPFGGYFNYSDFQIISSSPERFMHMKESHVMTRPIKGTRKRGTTDKEDGELKKELQNSEKDKSELLMIVDLERNDLNKVCVPGSVKVTELFSVEEYATVFHLIANIEGTLRNEYNAIDLLEAAFPGGSITGAPKQKAMEIIDNVEKGRRNIYTGSMGYLSLDGSCDFNIIIRTALFKNGTYHLGVGGGITSESELQFEYDEILQKAKAILDALS
jgi:para-aminobenzoate synthetase component 1